MSAPAFTLDTSGLVLLDPQTRDAVIWETLSPFAQGYIEALFSSEAERLNDERIAARMPLRRVRFSDLAPETLARIIADCEAADHLRPGVSDDGDHSAGRGLWELRQSGAYADRFPPLNVQLGDDGKVRFA